MKKLFAILAVAGILVACNDSGKTEEIKTDSSAVNAAPVDSSAAVTVDSSAIADSTKKAIDSIKK